MKNALLLLMLLPFCAHGRLVTLLIDANAPSNRVAIASNESVTLRSQMPGMQAQIALKKSGHLVHVGSGLSAYLPVAGPAEICLFVEGGSIPGGFWGYITLEIQTDTFPPDKTIIIPEGTGAHVALECSTNLTQWTELYSVTETNSPTHKFFRIKAERLP